MKLTLRAARALRRLDELARDPALTTPDRQAALRLWMEREDDGTTESERRPAAGDSLGRDDARAAGGAADDACPGRGADAGAGGARGAGPRPRSRRFP